MNYEDFYNKHYQLNYSNQESLAKSYFIDEHLKDRDFNYVFNALKEKIVKQCQTENLISQNKDLNDLLKIFNEKGDYYRNNLIQNILQNEITSKFNLIENLPPNYNFESFVKELAINNSNNEILRLLLINKRIYDMIFQLNSFDKFEIKVFGSDIESTSIFKELHQKIYPEAYTIKDNINLANQFSGENIIDNVNDNYQKKNQKKNNFREIHGNNFREFFTEEFRKKHFKKIEDLQDYMKNIGIKETAILVFLLNNEYKEIFKSFNLSGFIRSSKRNFRPQSIEKHFVAQAKANNYELKKPRDYEKIATIKDELSKIMKK